MSNELILPVSGLAVSKYADDKGFTAVAAGSQFLPRLQIFGGNSGECKRGLIGVGRLGLVRSKTVIEDLTPSCNVLPINWRPKAMRIDDGDVTSFYNPQSAEFQRIQEESEDKDSGAIYGPEFLLWVPDASPPCFASLFCANKTLRREAPNIKGLIGRGATLKADLIETKKYTWHGIIAVPCSTPFQVPDMEEINKVNDKFANPPEADVEVVDTEDSRAR